MNEKTMTGVELAIDKHKRFEKIANRFRELKNRIKDEDVLSAEILMKNYKEEVK